MANAKGLLDIAPLRPHQVTIERPGSEPVMIEVSGLTALGIAEIIYALPQVRKQVQDQGDELNIPSILQAVPEAVGHVIAAATGHPGDVQHIEAANGLTLGEQMLIVERCLSLTVTPETLGPFVGLVMKFMNMINTRMAQNPSQSSEAA